MINGITSYVSARNTYAFFMRPTSAQINDNHMLDYALMDHYLQCFQTIQSSSLLNTTQVYE